MRVLLTALILLAGCKKEVEGAVYDGLLDMGVSNPWPNTLVIDEAGRLDIPADVAGDIPTPDPSRLSWRTGFSPSQTAVLQLPDIDPSDFPGPETIRPGEGSVRLLDVTEGVWLPVMAELDGHPDADQPALLVRPLRVLPSGHEIAVVVTTGAVERPESFDALLSGTAVGNEELASRTAGLVESIASAGTKPSEIAVAWSFPVGDPSAPLRSALGQLQVSGDVRFDIIRDRDQGDTLVPSGWRAATGSFAVTDFLVDDKMLNLQNDGAVLPTGEARAHLYVHIPESVRDAPAGTVPVLVFGHGIFASPEVYLDDPDDPSGVQALAEEGGFIVVGTRWRGLTTVDTPEVFQAANDFSLFPVVAERLVQGQVDARTLVELVVEGSMFDDPIFEGASGQRLPIEGRAVYYGISLGAIQGSILAANDAPLDASVFHVGGAMWSTMLERSSNWTLFEAPMVDSVPEPSDRQLLYSMSQLWWDFADPATFSSELDDLPMLYQYSIGDEQVPNLTTEALARSIDLPLLAPEAYVPWGIQTTGALGPGSRALVQFDPEVPLPDPANRPGEESGAHNAPRVWPGTSAQTLDHLRVGQEGQVIHHCGDSVCSESNQGA